MNRRFDVGGLPGNHILHNFRYDISDQLSIGEILAFSTYQITRKRIITGMAEIGALLEAKVGVSSHKKTATIWIKIHYHFHHKTRYRRRVTLTLYYSYVICELCFLFQTITVYDYIKIFRRLFRNSSICGNLTQYYCELILAQNIMTQYTHARIAAACVLLARITLHLGNIHDCRNRAVTV